MTLQGELIAYRPSRDDVLFFETEQNITPEGLMRIKAQIQEHLPEGVEVIVLAGIKVSVVHKRPRKRWWRRNLWAQELLDAEKANGR